MVFIYQLSTERHSVTIKKITEELQKTLGPRFKVAIVIESLPLPSADKAVTFSIDESKPVEELLLPKDQYLKITGKTMVFGVRKRLMNRCGDCRVRKVGDLFRQIEGSADTRTFAQRVIDSSRNRRHRLLPLRNIGTDCANYFEDCLRIFGLVDKVSL